MSDTVMIKLKKQRIGTGYETDSTAGMTATQPSQPSQFSQLSQDTMGSLPEKSSSTDDRIGSLYENALELFILLTNPESNPDPNTDKFNDIGNHCYNIVIKQRIHKRSTFTLSVMKDGIEFPRRLRRCCCWC
jgi:hypothetical protein